MYPAAGPSLSHEIVLVCKYLLTYVGVSLKGFGRECPVANGTWHQIFVLGPLGQGVGRGSQDPVSLAATTGLSLVLRIASSWRR